ncbi:MAG: DUF1643 domain-containing protein [Caldilineaceae bacterium]
MYHPPAPANLPPHPARTVVCHPTQPVEHRYLLDVRLGAGCGPTLLIIQKNPSRADATRTDPTVRAVERWCRAAGYGRVLFANLFAWRSPAPEALNACSYAVAVGPDNDATLSALLQCVSAPADCIVPAWGNPNGIEAARYARRINEVLVLLEGYSLWSHGAPTRAGNPRHGLWWRKDDLLQPWNPLPPSPKPV